MNLQETSAQNAVVLSNFSEQVDAMTLQLAALTKTLLVTQPISKRKVARILASVQTLKSMAAMLFLLRTMMNHENTGTAVSDVAEILDSELNDLEGLVNAYVEARRGDVTDTPLAEDEILQTAVIVKSKLEAKQADKVLASKAEALLNAQADAEAEGKEVSLIGDFVRIHHKDPYAMSLTTAPVMVS